MRFHIVDTFADERFLGNPAAVVQADEFPSPEVMQAVASQVALPTTAFVVSLAPAEYRVRWFTPHKEINLCGHATIASARLLFGQAENADRARLTFVSDHGTLYTERVDDLMAIDLPTSQLTATDPPPGLLEALGVNELGTHGLGVGAVSCVVSSDDVLVEVSSAEAVSAIRPNFPELARQPFRGHIVTARGTSGADFVSRTFFPFLGVDEDQVCVTAHCKLTPFWAARLGRPRLAALQLSERGGRLEVQDAGDQVRVLGTAVLRDAVGSLTAQLLSTDNSR